MCVLVTERLALYDRGVVGGASASQSGQWSAAGRPLPVVCATFNRGDLAADARYRVRHYSRRPASFSARSGVRRFSLRRTSGRTAVMRRAAEAGTCCFAGIFRKCCRQKEWVGLRVQKYPLSRCSLTTSTQEDSATGNFGLYPHSL